MDVEVSLVHGCVNSLRNFCFLVMGCLLVFFYFREVRLAFCANARSPHKMGVSGEVDPTITDAQRTWRLEDGRVMWMTWRRSEHDIGNTETLKWVVQRQNDV